MMCKLRVLIYIVLFVFVTSACNRRPPLGIRPFADKIPSSDSKLIAEIPTDSALAWSPRSNELVYLECPNSESIPTEGKLIHVWFDKQAHTTIAAQGFICSNNPRPPIWSPDGKHVLFLGFLVNDVNDFVVDRWAHIWISDLTSPPQILVNSKQIVTHNQPYFQDWVDEQTLLYVGYGGGGHISGTLINVEDQWSSHTILSRGCQIISNSLKYISGCEGRSPTSDIEVMVYDQNELRLNRFDLDQPITEIDLLAGLNRQTRIRLNDIISGTKYHSFNSDFIGWRSGTNQMLIETWASDSDRSGNPSIHIDLQLWDLDADELTLLAANARHGRFSQDGRYLVYVSINEASLRIEDLINNELSFVKKIPIRYQSGYLTRTYSYSISPIGGFLSFMIVEDQDIGIGELQLFDLAQRETASTLIGSAYPRTYWSPKGNRLLYRDKNNHTYIYTLENRESALLAAEPLQNAFWSADGTYVAIPLTDRTLIYRP